MYIFYECSGTVILPVGVGVRSHILLSFVAFVREPENILLLSCAFSATTDITMLKMS